MAQLKRVCLDKIRGAAKPVRVGHNRHIGAEDGIFIGYLHGHNIFEWDPSSGTVCLDPCGYATVTTNAAMKDFMRYFRIEGGVSFAKGRFSVRARSLAFSGEWKEAERYDQRGPIAIAL